MNEALMMTQLVRELTALENDLQESLDTLHPEDRDRRGEESALRAIMRWRDMLLASLADGARAYVAKPIPGDPRGAA